MITFLIAFAACMVLGVLINGIAAWRHGSFLIADRQCRRYLDGKDRYYTSMEEAQHRPYLLAEQRYCRDINSAVLHNLSLSEEDALKHAQEVGKRALHAGLRPRKYLKRHDQRNVRSSKQVFAEIDAEIKANPRAMMEFLATDPGRETVLEVERRKAEELEDIDYPMFEKVRKPLPPPKE